MVATDESVDVADTSDVEADPGGDDDEPAVLATVKEAPGNLSLETVFAEIDKLLATRAIAEAAYRAVAALARLAPENAGSAAGLVAGEVAVSVYQ